jgi:hypothetical protein
MAPSMACCVEAGGRGHRVDAEHRQASVLDPGFHCATPHDGGAVGGEVLEGSVFTVEELVVSWYDLINTHEPSVSLGVVAAVAQPEVVEGDAHELGVVGQDLHDRVGGALAR